MDKDWDKELQVWRQRGGECKKELPEVTTDFMHLLRDGYKDGALSHKTKELMALGMGVNAKCEGCITMHCKAAIDAGATLEEIAETIQISISMGGGPSWVYGGLALQVAKQYLKD